MHSGPTLIVLRYPCHILRFCMHSLWTASLRFASSLAMRLQRQYMGPENPTPICYSFMRLGRTANHLLSSLSLSQCRSTIEGSSVSTLDKVPFTRKPESKHLSFLHRFAPNAHSRVISTSERSQHAFTATCQNEVLRFHSIHNTVDEGSWLSLESF
jgi:predicted glutamine amidotransferase